MAVNRVLVTGARGMLGRRVVEVLQRDFEIVAATRDGRFGETALDVTDAGSVNALVGALKPRVIVNCAAYTAVDRAETEREHAWRANALAPGLLAEAAERVGALCVHVSTDFVFDGLATEPYVETDAVGPVSVYARTKEEGERRVRAATARHLIVRTQWLYGPDGRHFPATMLRLAREGRRLRVVDDQIGAPTLTVDVAEAMGELIRAGVTGTAHCANRGRMSWCGFARAVLAAAGIDAEVVPISTAEFGAPAVRPPFSVLRNSVMAATIGDRMRECGDALVAFAAAGGLR